MEDTTTTQARIIRDLIQPMTTAQIAHAMKIPIESCMSTVRRLAASGMLTCLNPTACKSRIYWFTSTGLTLQARLRQQSNLPRAVHDVPQVDWNKYGSVCFSHRAIAIRTLRLGEPLQPAQIKRRAYVNDSSIRFSSNNARDVIRYLKKAGIVQPVQFKRRKHLRYELTEEGLHFQRLLKRAEVSR